MKALILAGGYATRLRPLSYTKPKLLFPLAGKPMLEWTLNHLSQNDIKEVILAVNYMADILMNHFGGEYRDVRIHYSKDPTPLGTGGPIKKAEEILGKAETFLAANGDIISDIAIKEMLKAHVENSATVTIALRKVKDPSRFGVVKLGPNMRIEKFAEKPRPSEAPSKLINAGIYLMEPEVFRYIAAGKVSTEKEVFPVLAKEKKLYGYEHRGLWFDVGKIGDYVEADRFLLNRSCAGKPVVEQGANISHGAELIPPVIIGKNAQVQKGSLIGPYTSVSQKVQVEKESKVRNSIIFESARIGESSIINEAIVGEGAVIGRKVRVNKGAIISGYTTIRDNVTLARNVIVHPYKEVEKSVLRARHVM